MATPVPARPIAVNRSAVLFVISAACFVVAALAAAAVFTGQSWIAWALGGVAAWILSGVV